MEVRKHLVDAGYIAIGVGVMTAQQVQARARVLRERAAGAADCATARARRLTAALAERGDHVGQTTRDAADRAQQTLGQTVGRVQELGTELTSRVEPIVEQVQARVTEIPALVVQAIEPVATRVRERIGTAA